MLAALGTSTVGEFGGEPFVNAADGCGISLTSDYAHITNLQEQPEFTVLVAGLIKGGSVFWEMYAG